MFNLDHSAKESQMKYGVFGPNFWLEFLNLSKRLRIIDTVSSNNGDPSNKFRQNLLYTPYGAANEI